MSQSSLRSADQINNATSAQLTYQVSADGMLGVSGNFASLYYPNPEEVSGLYNSRSAGGSAFYSRRLGEKYYVGANYQYQNMLSYQACSARQTRTQTQTVFAFLSVYLETYALVVDIWRAAALQRHPGTIADRHRRGAR